MEVKINNCNNIETAKINIKENMLNIKYAMNGTGKSTIGKALYLDDLSELKTFGGKDNPSITKDIEITSVLFDENFVNNIVFKGSEVIENSFDIFIKSDNYDEKRKNVDNILKNLTLNIFEDEALSDFYNKLEVLSSKIIYKSGNIHKKGVYQSILKRENIFKIPKELSKYEEFISNKEKNISWVKWKLTGFDLEQKGKCPFCTEKLIKEYEAEKNKFKETYTKPDVENLNKIVEIFESISEYIEENQYKNIMECIKEKDKEDEINMVFNKVMSETNYIKDKLIKIKEFNSYNVDNQQIKDLKQIVEDLYISTKDLNYYTTKKAFDIFDKINKKIDGVLEQITTLKKEIGDMNGLIIAMIRQSKKEINYFLNLAGFNYEFDIVKDGDEKNITTILRYNGKNNEKHEVSDISNHLSWGERNAFALVLFMYYSLTKNPDLIILDDPISSFDGNKKYAIMNRLFENRKDGKSFYNKTVLMLTHDFEPAIDFGINHKPNGQIKISYLKNEFGNVIETNIEPKEDIKSIIQIYYENAMADNLNIISRINFLRGYIEHTNVEDSDIKNRVYDILSSIIHGRNLSKKYKDEFIQLSDEEIEDGNSYIREFIKEFNGREILNKITDKFILSEYRKEENNYIKLQLFRIYLKLSNNRVKLKDDVLLKFVDEIYHIENDYMFSLNLIKFDIVPTYIISKIDKFMESETKQKMKELIDE